MIERQVRGVIVLVNGARRNGPVVIDLKYDRDTDPLAVEMTFSQPHVSTDEPVTWVISRDLMMDALVSKGETGLHDVLFVYDSPLDGGTGMFNMTLVNPDGATTMRLPYNRIALFLAETAREVPRGSEDITRQIDRAIEEILA